MKIKILLSIFLMLIFCSGYSQVKPVYIKFGDLYRNNNVFVELWVKKAIDACNTNTNNKFKIYVSNPGKYLEKIDNYLSWQMNVVNCKGDTIVKTFCIDLKINAEDGNNVSIDWDFDGIVYDSVINQIQFTKNNNYKPDQIKKIGNLKKSSFRDLYLDTFKTVTIQGVVWTSSNLNVSHFRNGDIIPEARTKDEWVKAADFKKPAWCYYGNDSLSGRRFGKLYNWYAISDERGLAPNGFHISADYDWGDLYQKFPFTDQLKSSFGWACCNGDNKSGFSALPSGWRDSNGNFFSLYEGTRWWTTMGDLDNFTTYRGLENGNYASLKKGQSIYGFGYSVRFVRD
jgi:uncharacterized protein (TIGR02145 family)